MVDSPEVPSPIRRGLALALAAALAIGSSGPALAQSSTTPPPMAPSDVPMGGTASAPANPGTALPPAGPAPSAGQPGDGTPPLKNDTPPPGVTKAGQ